MGRSVARWMGRRWPWSFERTGLGSKVSICAGPPLARIWMTYLARARKCGARGASGPAAESALLAASAANSERSPRSAASPSVPKPAPQRRSMSRRERWVLRGRTCEDMAVGWAGGVSRSRKIRWRAGELGRTAPIGHRSVWGRGRIERGSVRWRREGGRRCGGRAR